MKVLRRTHSLNVFWDSISVQRPKKRNRKRRERKKERDLAEDEGNPSDDGRGGEFELVGGA